MISGSKTLLPYYCGSSTLFYVHTHLNNRKTIPPAHLWRPPGFYTTYFRMKTLLAEGQRPAHGPKKRFKNHLKKNMKSFDILPGNLEEEAEDRSGWRATCARGATHFEAQRTQSREARRARRHDARDRAQAAAATDHAGLTCPECGRSCLSRIGLFSHRRAHQPGSARGRHVINGNVGLP